MAATRRIAALLLVFLMSWVSAPAAAEVKPQKGWLGLQSANFYVIGDAGEGTLRQVTRQLEQFREAFGILFPKAVLNSPTPTTVIVFRSNKAFLPFKPLYQGKPMEHVAGYFMAGDSVNYITMTSEGGPSLDVIYHEYVHMLVNNTLTGVPAWFNEGLAEFYRTFAVESGRNAYLGRIITPHVLLLREQFIPLATLATVDRSSPLYNESNRASIFYAESWALVHYLVLGQNQKYASKVAGLVGALVDGMPFERACTERLGIPVAMLERELRNYVQREAFVSQRATFTERIGKVDGLTGTPIAEANAHAVLGDLLRRMGRTSESQAELDLALTLDPDCSAAHTSLGLLLVSQDQPGPAREHLKRGVDAPGATYLTFYHYAWSIRRMAESAGGESDADRAAIESALARTIALNPTFAEAYAQLSWYRSRRPETAKDALDLITKALELSPGREEYALNLAFLLSNREDFANAKGIAAHLARQAKDEGVRASAQQLLDRITDFQRRKAEWAAGGAGRDDAAGPVGGSSSGAAGFRPAFRTLKPGETRAFGKLIAIACTRAAIVVTVDIEGAPLKARAAKFEDVEFVSFRKELSGQIGCGARKDQDPVMVVYRPEAGGDSAGILVSIEFVPLDFRPR
jgi:tetratricopeptide (TPR) repeat protein